MELEYQLEKLLSQTKGKIGEAARYAVLNGGKRLRPRLLLATAAAYRVPTAHALIPACALEFIHTYSLIHDDLPCMDDDDFRRGKPSLHKAFPEWHALLTGDFLLTYAFQILSEAPHLSPEHKIALIRTLSFRSGAQGMIGGQETDLSTPAPSLPALIALHHKKTGALITTALECGGILGNSPDSGILSALGMDLGLAFQILDDLADASNDLSHPSICHFMTPNQAHAYAYALLDSALSHISSLSRPAYALEKIVEELKMVSV